MRVYKELEDAGDVRILEGLYYDSRRRFFFHHCFSPIMEGAKIEEGCPQCKWKLSKKMIFTMLMYKFQNGIR